MVMAQLVLPCAVLFGAYDSLVEAFAPNGLHRRKVLGLARKFGVHSTVGKMSSQDQIGETGEKSELERPYVHYLEKMLQEEHDNLQRLNLDATAQSVDPKQEEAHVPHAVHIEADNTIHTESYGFISRSEVGGVDESPDKKSSDSDSPYYQPPPSFVSLATRGFRRNLKAIFDNYDERATEPSDDEMELQSMVAALTLNTTGIWARERETELANPFVAPLLLRAPYYLLCALLDVASAGGDVPSRLFVLEQIGRAPYVSFMTLLDFYETLGWWRPSNGIELAHVSEAYNKLHHSKMMEELGGDQEWIVRTVALHAALFTQLAIGFLWLLSPSLAYKFASMLESHAFHTYSQLLEENEDMLQKLPMPPTAAKYLSNPTKVPQELDEEPWVYSEYEKQQQKRVQETLEGMVEGLSSLFSGSLFDVFESMRDNTLNHVLTLHDCYDVDTVKHAESIEKKLFGGLVVAFILGLLIPMGLGDATFMMH